MLDGLGPGLGLEAFEGVGRHPGGPGRAQHPLEAGEGLLIDQGFGQFQGNALGDLPEDGRGGGVAGAPLPGLPELLADLLPEVVEARVIADAPGEFVAQGRDLLLLDLADLEGVLDVPARHPLVGVVLAVGHPEQALLPRSLAPEDLVQGGLVVGVPRQDDGLFHGQELLRLEVPAMDLRDHVIPVLDPPAGDRYVFRGPGLDVLQGLPDLGLVHGDGLVGDLNAPVVGKVEIGQDLERHGAKERLAVLVLEIPDLGNVDGIEVQGLELRPEDPGDDRVVDVVEDVVVEEIPDHVPGGVALAEARQLDLSGVIVEDGRVFLFDLVGRDLEGDLLAAWTEVDEAVLVLFIAHDGSLFLVPGHPGCPGRNGPNRQGGT